MSLNIQTPDGLLEIGGKVTKEKVISALGYSPANEEVETTVDNHTKDTDIHVTTAEKQAWNNKSDFSGEFKDLNNSPITEDDSGEVVYADEDGNIIAKIGQDGISTTNVNTKSMKLNGEDLDSRLKSLESNSSGNILDNESGDFVLADEDGNVIMKVDAEGMHSTEAELSGIKVRETLVEHNNHVKDTDKHITSEERTKWNNKSDFSGDYNDLENAPDIVENESGEVVYTDESGNIIAKIGQVGLETTQVTAKTMVVNGTDVEAKLNNLDSTFSSHNRNTNIHITSEERANWNAKATTGYVDEAVAGIVNSAPDRLNTLDELAAALGDDENFATTVTNSLAEKAKRTDLDNLKSELSESIESESGEWAIVDSNGNIIARIDPNGLETTQVIVQTIVVDGTDIKTALNEKAPIDHIHNLTATDIDIDYSAIEFNTSEIVGSNSI